MNRKVVSWIVAGAYLLLINTAFAACPAGSPGGINCTIGSAFVNTNAALKAATAGFSTYVYRAGYYSVGDGGDALYSWSAGSSCADDGGSCIAPTAGAGRWLLSGNGATSIKVFGAHCDGTQDDTIAIRNTLAARSTAIVPANSTCIIAINSNSDGIPMHTGYHIQGENTYSSVLQVNVNATSTFPQFDFAQTGKFVNITVSQIFPPQPYLNTGTYSWDAFTTATGGNGSLTGGATYYIKVAAVDAAGVSTPSALWHIQLAAGTTNTISVDMPRGVIGDGTGFNVYASTTSGGTYFKQNASVQTATSTFTFGTSAAPFLSSGTAAPTSNSTSVTAGDVHTAWSHQMQIGATVSISGSATAALNNPSYTIQRLTYPDHFIINTTGVAAGTYTDPIHIIGPSGIGTTVFYAWNRDDPVNGGQDKEIQKIELDHFTIYAASTGTSIVLMDASGVYSARFHHLDVKGPVARSGIVGLRCADASPYSNTINGACFFGHFSDITGSFGTGIHLSVDNNPSGPGPNAGDDMFDNWQGGADVFIDTTTVGSLGENGGGKFLQGYFAGTGEALNYTYYPTSPTGSHLELWQCEGCSQHGDPATSGYVGGANLTVNNATPNLFGTLPPFTISGGGPTVAVLPTCQRDVGFYFVTDAPSATPTLGSPVTTGGGTFTVPVFCDGVGPNWKYY